MLAIKIVLYSVHIYWSLGFPRGSVVKNLPDCDAGATGDACSIPGSRRSPGEGNGNPLQYLAWRSPWTEEPGRLQSIGSQELDMIKAT